MISQAQVVFVAVALAFAKLGTARHFASLALLAFAGTANGTDFGADLGSHPNPSSGLQVVHSSVFSHVHSLQVFQAIVSFDSIDVMNGFVSVSKWPVSVLPDGPVFDGRLAVSDATDIPVRSQPSSVGPTAFGTMFSIPVLRIGFEVFAATDADSVELFSHSHRCSQLAQWCQVVKRVKG